MKKFKIIRYQQSRAKLIVRDNEYIISSSNSFITTRHDSYQCKSPIDPLNNFWTKQESIKKPFQNCIGRYTIENNELKLAQILVASDWGNYIEMDLRYIFSNTKGNVSLDWFTGKLTICIHPILGTYKSPIVIFLELDLVQGNVINKKICENTPYDSWYKQYKRGKGIIRIPSNATVPKLHHYYDIEKLQTLSIDNIIDSISKNIEYNSRIEKFNEVYSDYCLRLQSDGDSWKKEDTFDALSDGQLGSYNNYKDDMDSLKTWSGG